MPLFGGETSPFDEVMEKATGETKTGEDWGLMLDICDRVAAGGSKGAKDALISIKKRLNHRDPHVTMLALSMLDACWNNCGDSFRREVSSREMVAELRSKATSSHHKVAERVRQLLAKWSEDECKKDAALSLIPSLVGELRSDGYSFSASGPAGPPKAAAGAQDASRKPPTRPEIMKTKRGRRRFPDNGFETDEL